MKKALFVFLIPVCIAACNNNTTTTAPATAPADTAAAVTLPYTATYSSSFVAGKQSDVLTTLNNYKAWENGDLAGMKATCGDSITQILSNGKVYSGTNDSINNIFAKFRQDSLSKVELSFYAWTSNHSVDKNQDWVNVWYKETDTYKTGRVDSAVYEDDNRLVNGKIVWGSSHRQKLNP